MFLGFGFRFGVLLQQLETLDMLCDLLEQNAGQWVEGESRFGLLFSGFDYLPALAYRPGICLVLLCSQAPDRATSRQWFSSSRHRIPEHPSCQSGPDIEAHF